MTCIGRGQHLNRVLTFLIGMLPIFMMCCCRAPKYAYPSCWLASSPRVRSREERLWLAPIMTQSDTFGKKRTFVKNDRNTMDNSWRTCLRQFHTHCIGLYSVIFTFLMRLGISFHSFHHGGGISCIPMSWKVSAIWYSEIIVPLEENYFGILLIRLKMQRRLPLVCTVRQCRADRCKRWMVCLACKHL